MTCEEGSNNHTRWVPLRIEMVSHIFGCSSRQSTHHTHHARSIVDVVLDDLLDPTYTVSPGQEERGVRASLYIQYGGYVPILNRHLLLNRLCFVDHERAKHLLWCIGVRDSLRGGEHPSDAYIVQDVPFNQR